MPIGSVSQIVLGKNCSDAGAINPGKDGKYPAQQLIQAGGQWTESFGFVQRDSD